MNHMFLIEEVGKNPKEISEMLLKNESAYYSPHIGWSDKKTYKSIRISEYQNTFVDVDKITDFEEYTNQVTMMPWYSLYNYLTSNKIIKIKHVFHAAFLLDIAVRNCIEPNKILLQNIKSFRLPDKLILAVFVNKQCDIDLNDVVYKILNLVIPRDYFVRV